MTKAVSKRKIYSIKAQVLLREHGHFSKNVENCVFSAPPPSPILLGLKVAKILETLIFYVRREVKAHCLLYTGWLTKTI